MTTMDELKRSGKTLDIFWVEQLALSGALEGKTIGTAVYADARVVVPFYEVGQVVNGLFGNTYRITRVELVETVGPDEVFEALKRTRDAFQDS